MTGAFQQEGRAQAHPVRIILLRDFVFMFAVFGLHLSYADAPLRMLPPVSTRVLG
jgi:hypothetical protein